MLAAPSNGPSGNFSFLFRFPEDSCWLSWNYFFAVPFPFFPPMRLKFFPKSHGRKGVGSGSLDFSPLRNPAPLSLSPLPFFLSLSFLLSAIPRPLITPPPSFSLFRLFKKWKSFFPLRLFPKSCRRHPLPPDRLTPLSLPQLELVPSLFF